MVINSNRQKGVSIEDISILTDGPQVTGEDLAFKEFNLVSSISLGSRETHMPEATTSDKVTNSKDVVPSLENEAADADVDVDAALPKRKRRNRNRSKNKNCTNTVTPDAKDREEVAANDMDHIACQKMVSDNSGDNANEVDNTAHDVTGDSTQTQTNRRKKRKNRNQRKKAAMKDDTTEDVCTSIEGTNSTVCEHSEEYHLTPFEATEEVCPDSSVREENAQISSPEITTSDGVAQNHGRHRTVKDLMLYDEKFAKLQRRAYWRSCWFCKAEGYDTKMCGHCELVRYCGKDCQLQDFECHKHQCKLVHKFNTAISKVNPLFIKNLHQAGYSKQMSCSLGSIPDRIRFEMLGGPRVSVIVEIVEVIPDPIIWKVLVRDITNETAKITFTNTIKNFPMPWLNPFIQGLNIAMARILKPGHFLLLLNIFWRFYEHKAACLIVEDLNMIKVVDVSAQNI